MVTDLAKFHNKDIVCLGINPSNNQCIRPLPYIQRNYCLENNIFPGSKLTGIFTKEKAGLPHCEDRKYNKLNTSGVCSLEEYFKILKATLSPSLEDGFGTSPASDRKHFECECIPDKSLITIEVIPHSILIIRDQFKPDRIRCMFEDNQQDYRFISITDLYFCEYDRLFKFFIT